MTPSGRRRRGLPRLRAHAVDVQGHTRALAGALGADEAPLPGGDAMIYSSPSYGMGAVSPSLTQPITAQQAQRAKSELARMRQTLTNWLRFRSLNDAGASAATLVQHGSQRARAEAALAHHLYMLLSEVFDSGALPQPGDPDAAVKLAQIAINGRLPNESTQPAAVGFVWLWPIVVVVGAVALVVMAKIRSSAELAMERERTECIKAGKCTDYGFWLKLGGAAAFGWFLWDKVGLRERVTGLVGKRKR